VSVVDAFREAAAGHARCVWLDGGGAREWSSDQSLLGLLEPDDVSLTYSAAAGEVTRHCDGRAEVVGTDVFAVLEDEMAAGSRRDQWFGYLGYACRPDLPARPAGPSDVPDAVWMRPSRVRLFQHGPGSADSPADRGNRQLWGVATPHNWQIPRPTGDSAHTPADYAAAFAGVQEQLRAGNSYEVNLTYRLDAASDLDPVAAYLALRALNPAPYAGFLQHDVPAARAWLLSSSPERYALVEREEDGSRTIETKPIKGTTPRGATPAEDDELRRRLAAEPKFRAENLMITDLLRNDLAMVCDLGTVEVPSLLAVESYPSVHQLVSTVRGRLRDDVTTVGALRSLFPAGSMTGAPKLRTMQVIDEVEATPRAAYAGAFGWVSADGRADLGVVIRTLTTTGPATGTPTQDAGRWPYRLGTGGGITVQSDVDDEHAESRWKAERLLGSLVSDPSPT
jgi:para-aminobenzoate synthetase